MSAALQHQAAWEASFIGMVWKQKFTRVPELPTHLDLQGQAAVITGSNAGIGLECSRQFLNLRLSHLIMAVRSRSKGDAVAEQLRLEYPEARIDVWLVDMESYKSVQEFAAQCRTLDRLNTVILNAGCAKAEFARCGKDGGHETTLQVNYLSTALLASLLLPVLRAKSEPGCPGRLTFVGSDTGLWVTPESIKGPSGSIIETMDCAVDFDGLDRYARSKALVFMFMSRLAETVSPDEVIVNAVNPSGVYGTAIGREANGFVHGIIVFLIDILCSKDLTEGTRKYLHTALVLGKESHGSIADHVIRP